MESLSALLLPDRDNKRFHLSEELQKLACSKASLSPVQSISPLPPLSAAEALTSVTAWARRKKAVLARRLSLPSFTVGGVAVPWSWWHVAFRAGSEGEQPWGHTGFLLCCWQCEVLLPSC